jgi:hypothetical protein
VQEKTGKVPACEDAISPQELGPRGSQCNDPAGQPLLLSQWGWCAQLLGLDQAAGDTCGCCTGPRWDHHPQAIVPTASHGASPGIDHEAHQKPGSMTDPCGAPIRLSEVKSRVPESCITHPVWTGLATGLMLSEVSVAGLLGMSESSSYSLDA